MRSLIILEVEHDESTDPLQWIVDTVREDISHLNAIEPTSLVNYTFRVDLPPCFVLD